MTRAAGALDIRHPAGGRRRPPTAVIIFDGDDTLWVTQWLYDQAEQETRLIVESAGLDGGRWQEICRERDFANVARFGFNSGRFPTSVVTAYAVLCEETGVPVRMDIVRELMRAASAIFQRRAPLAPGAEETLRALRGDFQLVLLTKGDPAVQHKRIRDSGLERLLDAVVVVPDKSAEVFAEICDRLGADRTTSWSVGNSLPSDVAPALAIGLRGIHVDTHAWDYEKRPTVLSTDHLTAASLREVPALIEHAAEGPMRRHQRRGRHAPPAAGEGLSA